MYTIEEKPTSEIKLDKYIEVYCRNIEAIMRISHMDRIIFQTSATDLKKWVPFIQTQVELYPQKEFYIPDRIYKLIKPLSNCKEYSTVLLANPANGELAKLIFLRVDLNVDYSDRLLEKVKKILAEKAYTCIVFFDCNNKISGIKYQKIMNNLQKLSETCEMCLSNTFISVESIVQHPCNAYLCSENKCHSKKSPYPRFLYITDKGIFPYGCNNIKISFCSNISTDIVNEFSSCFKHTYLKSEAYKNFITANKKIYRRYIVYSHFQVLPWNVFLEKVL